MLFKHAFTIRTWTPHAKVTSNSNRFPFKLGFFQNCWISWLSKLLCGKFSFYPLEFSINNHHWHVVWKQKKKQDSLPTRRAVSTYSAVLPGGGVPTSFPGRGVPHPIIHTCENSTFPILQMRAVTICYLWPAPLLFRSVALISELTRYVPTEYLD